MTGETEGLVSELLILTAEYWSGNVIMDPVMEIGSHSV